MVSAGGYLACFGEWFVEDYFCFGEFEGLSGAVVEEECDVVEVGPGVGGQVGSLGQVLAQEAVWCCRYCRAAMGCVERSAFFGR